MGTDLLWFGVRTWDLRVTDLMQGPVYGIETDESKIDERLRPLFNYDEVFGTIVNRFVTQAVIGYPLTVYGGGGQTRGYINIQDTMQCVYQSAMNPPARRDLRIFNQIMETFSANQLADMVCKIGRLRGHDVQVSSVPNPRREAEKHYYNPTYQGLRQIGVEPHLLTDDVLHEFFEVVEYHRENIRADVIFSGIKW
jgi:UDP-sulfoquinovose synthase